MNMKEFVKKYPKFNKKADDLQRQLTKLQKEADKIGQKEDIVVTLIPDTVTFPSQMEIILE